MWSQLVSVQFYDCMQGTYTWDGRPWALSALTGG